MAARCGIKCDDFSGLPGKQSSSHGEGLTDTTGTTQSDVGIRMAAWQRCRAFGTSMIVVRFGFSGRRVRGGNPAKGEYELPLADSLLNRQRGWQNIPSRKRTQNGGTNHVGKEAWSCPGAAS